MEFINTHFSVSSLDGRSLVYYYNREEFINDCIGIKNLEFSSEIFKSGDEIIWQNKKLVISSINIEFRSILTDGNRISNDLEKNKNETIVVTIFVEE